MDEPHGDPVEQLLYFLRLAHETSEEAIAKVPHALKFLAEVDDLFVRYLSEAGKVKPATAAILLMSAHATFRAAIGLALSGRLLPVFMTLRGCIESALYANAMAMAPKLRDIWLQRGSSLDARKACRNAFTISKMFTMLTEAHDKAFSASVQDVYDASIDFGAHPNPKSIVGSLAIEDLGSGAHYVAFSYVHGSGSHELRQSLIACAETGIRVLFVALILWSDHPLVEDLNARGLALQDGVEQLIESLGFERGDKGAP